MGAHNPTRGGVLLARTIMRVYLSEAPLTLHMTEYSVVMKLSNSCGRWAIVESSTRMQEVVMSSCGQYQRVNYRGSRLRKREQRLAWPFRTCEPPAFGGVFNR